MITAVALDETDTRVLTGSRDGTCMLWTLRLPRRSADSSAVVLSGPDHILHGHTGEVTAVTLCSEMDLAITAATDGTCNVYSVRHGRYIRTLCLALEGSSPYDNTLPPPAYVAEVTTPPVNQNSATDTSSTTSPQPDAAGATTATKLSSTEVASAAATVPSSDAAGDTKTPALGKLGPSDENSERDIRWQATIEMVLMNRLGSTVVYTSWLEQEPRPREAPTSGSAGGEDQPSLQELLPPPMPAKRRRRHTLHVYSVNGHLLTRADVSHHLSDMQVSADGENLVTVDRQGKILFHDFYT